MVWGEHWILGDYEQAFTCLVQATEVAEVVLHPEHLGAVNWTISQALASTNNRIGAKMYAVRSLAAYEEAQRRRLVISVYVRLGAAFARSGQLEKARKQLSQADVLATGLADLKGRAEIQATLADVYVGEKRYPDALQAVHRALEIARQLAGVSLQASALVSLAQVHEARKKQRNSTQAYEQAVELLQAQQSMSALAASEQLQETYAHFSEYLERQGEHAQDSLVFSRHSSPTQWTQRRVT